MRVKLSDLTKYSKGVQINGDDLIDNGKYIYLNGGINPSGRWNEANVGGNTITISEGGNSSGYVNYLTEPFWCGAHCYYLYDGPKNTRYLYYALKSQQERLFHIRSGACMPNIKKADLGKFEFEFNLDENKQEEVVSALSLVESIIDERKSELVLLDNIIKARFVEMFGDTEDFSSVSLEESVEEMFIGPFGSSLKNECFVSKEEGFCMVYEQKHAIRKTMDVETRFVDKSKYKELERFTVKGGDIIVSCRGTIGETFIVPPDAPLGIMHPSIMKIRLKKDTYDCTFFDYLLQNALKKHEAEANGSGVKMAITATALGKEKFIIPSMNLQKHFSAFVQQVDKSKFAVKKALDETQVLFDSLMQKYFG